MKIDVPAVRKCLKSFDFKTLFREQLGWDNHHAQLDIPVNGQTVSLCAIAQKRGLSPSFVTAIFRTAPHALRSTIRLQNPPESILLFTQIKLPGSKSGSGSAVNRESPWLAAIIVLTSANRAIS